MFESFVLGAVQGIAEWLPISSEAMVVLVKTNFFADGSSFAQNINQAIFLHLGTLLAVVIYFFSEVKALVSKTFSYQQQPQETKNYLTFIAVVTVISGVVGLGLIRVLEAHPELFANQQQVNAAVALFLLVTAILLYIGERTGGRGKENTKGIDSVVVGIAQGCAAIPGISRSGSTLASMALLGFNKVWAVKTSFILSIPIVFLANVVLNYQEFLNFSLNNFIAIVSACLFGLLTISALLKLVKKLRFSYFVLVFALILGIVTVVT
jgi:undecaprenyl-diphosphatase